MPKPLLGDRERAALTAVAVGHTHPAAARHLGISHRSLRRYLNSAVEQLGANGVVHAVALATAAGHINPDHLRDRVMPAWPAGITDRITSKDTQEIA